MSKASDPQTLGTIAAILSLGEALGFTESGCPVGFTVRTHGPWFQATVYCAHPSKPAPDITVEGHTVEEAIETLYITALAEADKRRQVVNRGIEKAEARRARAVTKA